MSVHDINISTEESRIMRLAGKLIEQEMKFVRDELEMLRADLNKTSSIQREELEDFYLDAMTIIKEGLSNDSVTSRCRAPLRLVKRDLSD